METEDRDRRYDDVKRCLAEADRAFARAGAVTDERERVALIDEAEVWLIRAERRLARITDRQVPHTRPQAIASEARSFGDTPHDSLVWRRTPKT
ncbi:MAG: hypothetical protein JWP86_2004 [Phenylobacterium sp.]|nr:hypothetical protein [Phenylobacterium sp.]